MKKKLDLDFIKETIEDYEKMANEHENLAKRYREVSEYWRKRYNIERSYVSPLAPLFFDKIKTEKVDEVRVLKTKKITFV